MTNGQLATELDPEPIPHDQATTVRELIHRRVPAEHRQTVLDALFQQPRHEQIQGPRNHGRKPKSA